VIPKVVTGGRTEGVLRYLLGKGRHNEHTEPQLVAGSAEAMVMAGGRTLDTSDARPLAQFLDEPKEQYGNGPRASIRDQSGHVTGWKNAHVWHCSLSLHPDEPALPAGAQDADPAASSRHWEALCERFVNKMGLAGEDAAGECRWVAVRHGRSNGGSDHAHVVVQLVGEDGRVPSTHFSGRRAQQAARELEREFGLRPLNATRNPGPSRWFAPGELECDERRDRPVNAHPPAGSKERRRPENGDRQTLERVVRAAAAASSDEGEFVAAVCRQGVQAIPRYSKGTTGQVVGYSVKFPDGIRYAGGKLARDLTIGALRNYWRQDPQTTLRCAAAWGPRSDGERADEPRRSPTSTAANTGARSASPPPSWSAATADLHRLCEQLAQASGDPMRISQVAREASAITAAWSLSLGADPRGRALARVARELGRAAQLPRDAGRRPALGPRVVRAQPLATLLLLSSPSASQALALIIALQRLAEDLVRARALKADTCQLVAQDALIRSELQRFGHDLAQDPLPTRRHSDQQQSPSSAAKPDSNRQPRRRR
jgi:hypothetical protein